MGAGPRRGPSRLGYPGSLGGLPASLLSVPVLSILCMYTLPLALPLKYCVLERRPALPAAVVYMARLCRALLFSRCVVRFPPFCLVVHRLPPVASLRPVHPGHTFLRRVSCKSHPLKLGPRRPELDSYMLLTTAGNSHASPIYAIFRSRLIARELASGQHFIMCDICP